MIVRTLLLLASILMVAGPVRAEPWAHAAVAADHPLASAAGLEMLQQGGNAVDAAVATSFALSVVRPYSCGIGGGGFMMIHRPGASPPTIALSYRERAPAAVGPDYYVQLGQAGASSRGPHAVGVPGTVAGLLHALDRYGTLDRATVLAPAIRIARDGWPADAHHVKQVAEMSKVFAARPEVEAMAGTLWTELCDGGALQAGDTLRNPGHAAALELIATDGRRAFYEGPIAEAIVSTMRTWGGPLTHADLAGYEVRELEPLRGTFRGRDVLAMPPPSSGGIAMLQMLFMLDRRLEGLPELVHNDPAYVHLVVETMKLAFSDRAAYGADGEHVPVPVSGLLAPRNLLRRADTISLERTRPAQAYGPAGVVPEDGGTSHLSVVDAAGMAVACTETINLVYGSMVVVPGFGFALNDEMDDFTTIPGAANESGLLQSDKNLPEPGKRPLSSMSPTIILRDGRAVLVAGASGGPRIITSTTQAILNCLLFDMQPADAVAAARFHHQWMPDRVYFEERWSDEATIAALAQKGHETARREVIGNVQVIRVQPDGLRAASDPRKGGAPAGY